MSAGPKLNAAQMLALVGVNICPLQRQGDGLWRFLDQNVPPEGFTQEDVRFLETCQFIEFMPIGAIVTEQGRKYLRDHGWVSDFPETPVTIGTVAATPTIN